MRIGTDPAEWWVGAETLERVYTAQIQEMHDAGVRIWAGDMHCYSDGNVGWCADQPRLVLPDGREQSMRITAVVHKEGNDWKIVQSHASFGVANADIIGSDLTTS